MKNYRELTSFCGIDCFNCDYFVDNITDESVAFLSKHMDIDKEKVACKGCRIEEGCHMLFAECKGCECVKEKGVDFCFECEEFPCEGFQPVAADADKYSHNMKLYNSCRIQKIGLERWAKEEAKTIREKYFKGKYIVGRGVILNGNGKKPE
ncbi:DUF3795 domain-containing protein [candidate division KSB1 bacterium]